jgi:recombination protein RecT
MTRRNKKMNENTNAVANTGGVPIKASEAFTNKVLKEFGGQVGAVQVTDYQRQLIQGYFIAIDRSLKMADEKRLGKNSNNKEHKYDNNDPINWNTVDLNSLALDVVHYARMGLDMMQDNHLSAIPYKDNNRKAKAGTQLYTVNLMPGYNGIQYIAEKYALEKPTAVTIELVYSTDTFKPVKKNRDNRVESYEFEINNAFDRGEVVGGFGYIEYAQPEKNKLVIMTMKDIEKRKPQYAAAEFWGGKTTKWEKGRQVEVETDGWREEMYLKTLKREVYSAKHMPRDPKKIDDAYQYMKQQELRMAALEAQDAVEANTGTVIIDMPEPQPQPIETTQPVQALQASQTPQTVTEPPADAKPVQQTIGNIVAGQFETETQQMQAASGGPGF